MSKLTEARDKAAKGFQAAINDVAAATNDRKSDPVTVAAQRLKAREIAGIYAERLIDAAKECRVEQYEALHSAIDAKRKEAAVKGDAVLAARAKAVAIMTELYGARGAGFAASFTSLPQDAAQLEANKAQSELEELEREAATLLAHQDNATRTEYSAATLAAMEPAGVASYALAYVKAANAATVTL
jgi:hypothetical protein